MKAKSLLRSLRIGPRKETLSSTTNVVGSGSSPSIQVNATSAVAKDVEPFGKDASNDQLVTQEAIDSKSIPAIAKDRYTLYTLHNPLNANFAPSEGQFPIDIVAIHGLDGGAHKTWTHGNNYYWLQDSLPSDIPGARVYSFGYPAETLFTREQPDISDFAKALLEEIKAERISPKHQQRPLVFVAHSMGGIIVKKAFNISHVDNERYGAIRRAVPAIVFLATPHRGSEYTEFFAKLARVVNVPLSGTSRYTGKTRANLIKSLGKHSETLSDISEDFRQHTEDRMIYSFLEQASTPPLHEKVVDDMSARLDVKNEIAIPMLGCDHRTICRFSGRDDPSYKRVFNILQEIATEATTSQ